VLRVRHLPSGMVWEEVLLIINAPTRKAPLWMAPENRYDPSSDGVLRMLDARREQTRPPNNRTCTFQLR